MADPDGNASMNGCQTTHTGVVEECAGCGRHGLVVLDAVGDPCAVVWLKAFQVWLCMDCMDDLVGIDVGLDRPRAKE